MADNATDPGRETTLVPGFHAVREAMRRGTPEVRELWLVRGKEADRVQELILMAGEREIPVRYKKRSEFDRLFPDLAHQGIAALTKTFSYVDLETVIRIASRQTGKGLILAVDHITDEGNLGALIRTAAFFGVHGLVLPRDRSAGVTERVRKRSSGGYAHLAVARVVNLARALDLLGQKGFWIIGTAEQGRVSLFDFDWNRDLVLVLGSEDRGIGRTTAKRCHELVKIPCFGAVGSLNVAVAGGVILSEIARQRAAP